MCVTRIQVESKSGKIRSEKKKKPKPSPIPPKPGKVPTTSSSDPASLAAVLPKTLKWPHQKKSKAHLLIPRLARPPPSFGYPPHRGPSSDVIDRLGRAQIFLTEFYHSWEMYNEPDAPRMFRPRAGGLSTAFLVPSTPGALAPDSPIIDRWGLVGFACELALLRVGPAALPSSAFSALALEFSPAGPSALEAVPPSDDPLAFPPLPTSGQPPSGVRPVVAAAEAVLHSS
jgi:hypothetical protein